MNRTDIENEFLDLMRSYVASVYTYTMHSWGDDPDSIQEHNDLWEVCQDKLEEINDFTLSYCDVLVKYVTELHEAKQLKERSK